MEPLDPGRWPLRHPRLRSPPGTPHRYHIRAHVLLAPSGLGASRRSISPSPAGHDPTPPAAGPRLTSTFLSRGQRRCGHCEQEPEGEGLGARHAARGASGTRRGCGAGRLRGQKCCAAAEGLCALGARRGGDPPADLQPRGPAPRPPRTSPPLARPPCPAVSHPPRSPPPCPGVSRPGAPAWDSRRGMGSGGVPGKDRMSPPG